MLLILGLTWSLAGGCSGRRFSPKEPGVWVEFQKDDKLEDLAALYQVEVRAILERNEIYDPEDLGPGIMIFIPGAKSKAGEKREANYPELDEKDPVLNSGKRFVWPAKGTLSSGFGVRHGKMHEGIDLTKDLGWEVLAAGAGRVVFAGRKSGYGNTLIIDHGRGIKTLYAHLSRIKTREGRRVRQGEEIGKIGNTGGSTGPHLHFEVRVNDKPQNPLRYLPIK